MPYYQGKASKAAQRFIRLAQERNQPALNRIQRAYDAAHKQLEADIARTAARAIESESAVLLLERQQALLGLIEATMQRYVLEVTPVIEAAAGDALDLGTRAGRTVMRESGIAVTQLGVNQFAVAASVSRMAQPVSAYLQMLPRLASQRARQMVTTGVTLGWHPTRVAREMTRSADIAHGRALLIARTEMLRAYREGNRAQWQAGGQVKGWIWQAALTGRTCPVCWAMNGTYHPISVPLESHPNCRCTQVPIPAGYQHRVPDPDERFAKLPVSTQRAILGPGRHDLYQRDGLKLADFVGERRDPVYGTQRYVRPVRELVRR